MQNPIIWIVDAADFLVRAVFHASIGFAICIVGCALAVRTLFQLAALRTPMFANLWLINSGLVLGAIVGALAAPRLLTHAPNWLFR